jgi:hypothetical protein
MTLDDWLAFAPHLDALYQQELGRSAFSDPQAFVNWAYHWREDAREIAWIRDRIRESPEWAQKHGTPNAPVTPDVPVVALSVIPVTAGGVAVPRLYSYWPNAWLSGNTATVFYGHLDGGPRVCLVDLASGNARASEFVLPEGMRTGTTEGWYWGAAGDLYACVGAMLLKVNRRGDAEVVMDVREGVPGRDDLRLWQAHSSTGGDVHTATVQQIVADGAYPNLGTLVRHRGQYRYLPAAQALDESQVTQNGQFLIVKEGSDNRIIDLDTDDDAGVVITNAEGALGHSDVGDTFIVGEDDQAGACVRLDLPSLRRRTLFQTWSMGHLSINGGRCLLSDATALSLVDLDTGVRREVLRHGSDGDPANYDYQVRANLDATGRVAAYTTYKDGVGHDLYLASVP